MAGLINITTTQKKILIDGLVGRYDKQFCDITNATRVVLMGDHVRIFLSDGNNICLMWPEINLINGAPKTTPNDLFNLLYSI